eukprot:Nk52_evm19s359 gene=Nk52_evmTU19s359
MSDRDSSGSIQLEVELPQMREENDDVSHHSATISIDSHNIETERELQRSRASISSNELKGALGGIGSVNDVLENTPVDPSRGGLNRAQSSKLLKAQSTKGSIATEPTIEVENENSTAGGEDNGVGESVPKAKPKQVSFAKKFEKAVSNFLHIPLMKSKISAFQGPHAVKNTGEWNPETLATAMVQKGKETKEKEKEEKDSKEPVVNRTYSQIYESSAEEHYLIDSQGTFWSFWKRFIIVAVFLQCNILPFMAAFPPINSRNYSIFPLTVSYACDLIYMLHIYLRFRTPLPDAIRGTITKDRELTVKRYKESDLCLDICAIFPFDLIAIFVGGRNFIPFLKLNRLLKIVDIYAYFGEEEDDLEKRLEITRGKKFSVLIEIMIMWVACVWFFVSCPYDPTISGQPPGLVCDEKGWAYQAGIANETRARQFIKSIYFSITTMTAVGYGDIVPQSVKEEILASFTMIMGVLTFSFVLATIASTISNTDVHRTAFRHQVSIINQYLTTQNTPPELIQLINDYYTHRWKYCKGVGNDVYAKLPISLQEEIALQKNKEKLKKVDLFEKCNDMFLRKVSHKLDSVTFSPGDTIILKGELGKEMFFIDEGYADVLGGDDSVLATLGPGTFFGEIAVLFAIARTATVKAATHCEVMVLTKKSLQECMAGQQELADHIHAIAEVRFEEIMSQRMNNCSEKERSVIPSQLRQNFLLSEMERIQAELETLKGDERSFLSFSFDGVSSRKASLNIPISDRKTSGSLKPEGCNYVDSKTPKIEESPATQEEAFNLQQTSSQQ